MTEDLNINSKAFKGGMLANYVLFLTAGMCIAPWAAIAPIIKDHFELSASLFAIMSACYGGGALISMLYSGKIIKRFGVVKTATVTLFLSALAVFLVSCRFLPWYLIYPSSAVWGGAIGVYEVTGSVHATLFEEITKRRLLSRFAAIYTIGCISATLVYPLFLRLGAPIECISFGGFVIAYGIFMLVRPYLVDTDGQKDEKDEAKELSPNYCSGVPLTKLLIFIAGMVSFFSLLCEGAVYDWSGVYLVSDCALPLSYAAFGFMCYEGTAGFVRLMGERLLKALGPTKLVCGGSLLACVALFIAGFAREAYLVLLGFTLLGAAAGNIMPVVISEAGRRCHKDKATTIGNISAMGYAGVLVGPALLGIIASFIDYAAIFKVVAVLMIMMLFMAYSFLKSGGTRQK